MKVTPDNHFIRIPCRSATDSAHLTVRNLLLTALLASLLGCASTDDSRSKVSDELQTRTGHPLGPASEAGQIHLPFSINQDQALTDDEAVAVALWNNAAFQEVLTDLGLTRADLVQARMLPNPTFSVLFPAGPKQLEFAAKLPLEAIWLRPKRVKVAELESKRVAQRLVQNGLNLVRDVKLLCADLRLAERRTSLAQENARLLHQIADLFQTQLQAGEISELEAASTQVEALRADAEMERLSRETTISQERLRNSLGLAFDETPLTLAQPPPPPTLDLAPDQLLKDALAARPDLRAAELALDAAGHRAGLAKREILTLTAVFDANGSGSDFESGPGLEFPIPILNQNQAGITRAQAQLDLAARQYIHVRDQIALEVRESHARWLQAQQALDTWQNQIIPSLNSLATQSQAAYEAGDISPAAVLQAAKALVDGRLRASETLADIHRTTAELERAAGHRLFPNSNEPL